MPCTGTLCFYWNYMVCSISRGIHINNSSLSIGSKGLPIVFVQSCNFQRNGVRHNSQIYNLWSLTGSDHLVWSWPPRTATWWEMSHNSMNSHSLLLLLYYIATPWAKRFRFKSYPQTEDRVELKGEDNNSFTKSPLRWRFVSLTCGHGSGWLPRARVQLYRSLKFGVLCLTIIITLTQAPIRE